MSQGCTISVEEIQSWCEVPAIAHFCSLFRTAFSLPDFEIEELEEALLKKDRDFLADLISSLLRGCYQRTDITPQAFSKYLDDIINHRWVLEEGKPNPLRRAPFEELPPRTQVELLHRLCDYRLDAADVFDLLKGLDADNLRVEPLGQDGDGALYWYFYGTRMYKEEPVNRKAGERGEVPEVRVPEKKKRGRPPKKKPVEKPVEKPEEKPRCEVGAVRREENGIEDRQPGLERERGSWSLVCDTEEQWLSLAGCLKDKPSPQDRHLHHLISRNFLPEISSMIEHKKKGVKEKQSAPVLSPCRPPDNCNAEEEEEEEALQAIAQVQQKQGEEEAGRQTRLAEQRREDEMLQEELDRVETMAERTRRHQYGAEKAWLPSQGKELPLEPHSLSHRPRRTKRFGEIDDNCTALYKVLETLKAHQYSWPFMEPVDDSYAPDYHKIIQTPMDLSTIEKKLNQAEYSSKDEFVSDVKLMFENCLEYNGENSDYTVMAEALDRRFTKALLKHFPPEGGDTDEEFCVGTEGQGLREQRQTRGQRPRSGHQWGPESFSRTPGRAQRLHGPVGGKGSASMGRYRCKPPQAHPSPNGTSDHSAIQSNSVILRRPKLLQNPLDQSEFIQHKDVGPGFPFPGERPTWPTAGRPNLQHQPYDPNKQVHAGESQNPIGREARLLRPQVQQPYLGPFHGPSLGPRPLALRSGGLCTPPPESNAYTDVAPQLNPAAPFRPSGLGMSTGWSGAGRQGLEAQAGPTTPDQRMSKPMNPHPFNPSSVPSKPWQEPPAGYQPPNGHYRMPAPISSPCHLLLQPPEPLRNPRPQPTSMLDSPEMTALQQLSASSRHPAGPSRPSPYQQTDNSQGPLQASSAPGHPPWRPPPETHPLRPARDNGTDSRDVHQPHTLPKAGLSPPEPNTAVLTNRLLPAVTEQEGGSVPSPTEHPCQPSRGVQSWKGDLVPNVGHQQGTEASVGEEERGTQPVHQPYISHSAPQCPSHSLLHAVRPGTRPPDLCSLPPSQPVSQFPAQITPAERGSQQPSEHVNRRVLGHGPDSRHYSNGSLAKLVSAPANGFHKQQAFIAEEQTQLAGQSRPGHGPSPFHNLVTSPHSQGPPHAHYSRQIGRPLPASNHQTFPSQSLQQAMKPQHSPAHYPSYHQQGGAYPHHMTLQNPQGNSNMCPTYQRPQYRPQHLGDGREWHRTVYQSCLPVPSGACIPVVGPTIDGRLKESSVSPQGSEASSSSLLSPGPLAESFQCGMAESRDMGSPVKLARVEEGSERLGSPKEILDLDIHNADARCQWARPPHVNGLPDMRTVQPGIHQHNAPPLHMLSRSPYSPNAFPGGPYSPQRHHPYLMEVLHRPRYLPFPPGGPELVYGHDQAGDHFQGMMVQCGGLVPEPYQHSG